MGFLYILLFISLYFFVYFFFTSATAKGHIGEEKVAKLLSQLPSSEYCILNDMTFQNEYGSVQIDHIVVSLYGIFVIETKNYSGWIMGSAKSEQWIKNMYGHKYYFYNPIKQNYGHITALKRILQIPKNYFISIIAFPYKADIKVHTDDELVLYFREIVPTILSYSKKIFSISDLGKIVNSLLTSQTNSKENEKNHIRYVKDKKRFTRNALRQDICPYCQSPLVIRNGKYGKFKGCSNYPKCKYTHPL